MLTSDHQNPEIRRVMADRQTQDTRIAQKILHAHREAFRTRFPGTVEHSLRLVAERLQHCLAKPEGCDPGQVSSWPATPGTIRDLSAAMESLWRVHEALQNQPEPVTCETPA